MHARVAISPLPPWDPARAQLEGGSGCRHWRTDEPIIGGPVFFSRPSASLSFAIIELTSDNFSQRCDSLDVRSIQAFCLAVVALIMYSVFFNEYSTLE